MGILPSLQPCIPCMLYIVAQLETWFIKTLHIWCRHAVHLLSPRRMSTAAG